MSLWQYNASESLVSKPLLCGDLLICNSHANLVAIDIYTGQQRWAHRLSTSIQGGLANNHNVLFFIGNPIDFGAPSSRIHEGGPTGEGHKKLVALDIGTGTYLSQWSTLLPHSPSLMTPIVDNQWLVLQKSHGFLYGCLADPGGIPEVKWQINLSLAATGLSDYTPGPAAVGDEAVFTVVSDELAAVNTRSGQLRWKFPDSSRTPAPGATQSDYELEPGDSLPQIHPPMVGKDLVLILGSSNLYALDVKTGRKKWTTAISANEQWNTPAVSWDGHCFFLTSRNGATAYGYKLSTGQLFWQQTLQQMASTCNLPAQVGGFFAPFIDKEHFALQPGSLPLVWQNSIFLPGTGGAIFKLRLTINQTAELLSHTDLYQVQVVSATTTTGGLAYQSSVGNGTLMTCNHTGEIVANNSLGQEVDGALLRPSASAKISLPYKAGFSFAKQDFSLEMWSRTTAGGELITMSPSATSNGFRLRMINKPDGIIIDGYGFGSLQFSIVDMNGNLLLLAQTEPSIIADGLWHHLALVRSKNDLTFYVDGISQPMATLAYQSLIPAAERARLPSDIHYFSTSQLSSNVTVPPIGGNAQGLTVGAYEAGASIYQDPTTERFDGLVADVRIWGQTLSASKIQDRMTLLLTGLEPHLIGYWPLNESNPANYADLTITGHPTLGSQSVPGVEACHTNLLLNDSLYPYLLNHDQTRWPYGERWVARAEDAPRHAPVGCGEVLCFATDRAVYGVDAIHGKRLWGLDIQGVSQPVADHRAFYVTDNSATTIRAYQPRSGKTLWQTNLHSQQPPSGNAVSDTPIMALTDNCLVCSLDRTHIYWLNRANGHVIGHYTAPALMTGDFLAEDGDLYLIANNQLLQFTDPPPNSQPSVAMSPNRQMAMAISGSPHMCADGGRVFVYDGGRVHMLQNEKKKITLDSSAGSFVLTFEGQSTAHISHTATAATVLRELEALSTITPGDIKINGKAGGPWYIEFQGHLALAAQPNFSGQGSGVSISVTTGCHGGSLGAWNPPSITGTVTGMTASAQANRLLIATDQGQVLFWDYGSGKQAHSVQLPGMSSAFTPVIHGHHLFCCGQNSTSTQGGVWVYDLHNASLRGQEQFPAPVVAKPYVSKGTAYLSVNDGGHGSLGLAGSAIHSVLFGAEEALKIRHGYPTLSVSHVDPVFSRGTPRANPFRVGNFTFEAWLNSGDGRGGELMALPALRPSGFNYYSGFSLAVNSQGCISAQHIDPLGGNQFTSESTQANDGKWHHIAAVFHHNQETNQQLCYMYLDGNPLTVNVDQPPAASEPVRDHRQLRIGGVGDTQFSGLLQDLRVWDTWLHHAEISNRRQIKLTGDEPNLLACWQFTDAGIKDLSNNHLNDPTANLSLWLTDLSFTAPNYPYITAITKPGETITSTPSNGHGKTITQATYQTNISARRSDGSPRQNTSFQVWADESVAIHTNTNPTPFTVGPTTPHTFTVDSDGKVSLHLECHNLSHSPVLWIRADFMFGNERFYVNSVTESQRHITIPPPHLTAQSMMMQDYAYTRGDSLGIHRGQPGHFTLHDHVDITTIRTTITAKSGQGRLLANEDVEIWADDHLEIEANGQHYPINAHNSTRLKTDSSGTLTLVVHEKRHPGGSLLTAPVLYARAGFMPHGSRFAIHPVEQAFKTLSHVTSDQIKGNAPIPNIDNKRARLIHSQEDQKAAAIADTLKHIMSLTKKVHPGSGQFREAIQENGLRDTQTDANDNLPPDEVSSLQNAAHLRYIAPITPEYMPHPHFVLSIGDNGDLSYTPFDTTVALEHHLRQLGLTGTDSFMSGIELFSDDDPAGGWLHSLGHDIKKGWDHFKHDVKKAWNHAKHFIVHTWNEIKHDIGEVVHYVEVVIADTAQAIGKWVIKTVKDVIGHVVAFLKKVFVTLKEIYEFLRAIFDWSQILDIRDLIEVSFQGNIQNLHHALDHGLPQEITQGLASVKTGLAHALGANHDFAHRSLHQYHHVSSGATGRCMAHCRSTKSKYLIDKIKAHATSKHTYHPNALVLGQGSLHQPIANQQMNTAAPNLGNDLSVLFSDAKAILTQGGSFTHLTLNELLTLLDDLLNTAIDVADEVLTGLVRMVGQAIGMFDDMLTAEIPIPFVSDLYKLITGHNLTILDLSCLVIAVPVNVVISAMSIPLNKQQTQAFIQGHLMFPQNPPQVAATIQNMNLPTANLEAQGHVTEGMRITDFSFLVLDVINGVLSAVTDEMQGELNLTATVGEPSPTQSFSHLVLGTIGSFAAATTSGFQWGVRMGYRNKWRTITAYAGMVGPLFFLALGAKGIYDIGSVNASQSFDNPLVDKLKRIPVSLLLTLVGVGALGYAIYDRVHNHLEGEDAGENLMDIVNAINTVFAFLDFPPICKATEVEGDVLSALGLAGLDLVIKIVATPAIHITAGYGKDIL